MTPWLEAQSLFKQLWSGAGLSSVCPLRFDQPKEGEVNPPYCKAKIKEGAKTRFDGAEIVMMKVECETRIPEGHISRASIEAAWTRMNEQGFGKRILGGSTTFVDLKSKEPMFQSDSDRMGGVGVELIPKVWELWIEVET